MPKPSDGKKKETKLTLRQPAPRSDYPKESHHHGAGFMYLRLSNKMPKLRFPFLLLSPCTDFA